MGKRSELLGVKFTRLLVIGRGPNKSWGERSWICQCDCGSTIEVAASKLKNEETKSCGCLKLTTDLVGKKYGYLTVLERSRETNKNLKYPYWLCQCDCGIIKEIRGDALTQKSILSCGCKHPRKPHSSPETPKISSAKTVYRKSYSDGDLSFDDFYKLSQLNCYYCDSVPNNSTNIFISSKSTLFARENGVFIYNGLDRIDSYLPHNLDNVVPCCYPCNWSKSNRNIEDFKNWILKVAKKIQDNQI